MDKEKNKLIKGQDYIISENGKWIFTREYHLKRGNCCGSGCINCPYDHINVNKKLIIK